MYNWLICYSPRACVCVSTVDGSGCISALPAVQCSQGGSGWGEVSEAYRLIMLSRHEGRGLVLLNTLTCTHTYTHPAVHHQMLMHVCCCSFFHVQHHLSWQLQDMQKGHCLNWFLMCLCVCRHVHTVRGNIPIHKYIERDHHQTDLMPGWDITTAIEVQ